MVSKSQEEYLKTMYLLYKKNNNIRVTDIANSMNCSKASVNKAINILKQEKLVIYETYGKIELTKDGINIAKKLVETYDIVYLFLKDILKLDKKEAKDEAEKLKKVMSDNTINNLAKYVYSTLGIGNLDCCYDINKEKCRECSKKIDIKMLAKNSKVKLKKEKKVYKKGN